MHRMEIIFIFHFYFHIKNDLISKDHHQNQHQVIRVHLFKMKTKPNRHCQQPKHHHHRHQQQQQQPKMMQIQNKPLAAVHLKSD